MAPRPVLSWSGRVGLHVSGPPSASSANDQGGSGPRGEGLGVPHPLIFLEKSQNASTEETRWSLNRCRRNSLLLCEALWVSCL